MWFSLSKGVCVVWEKSSWVERLGEVRDAIQYFGCDTMDNQLSEVKEGRGRVTSQTNTS